MEIHPIIDAYHKIKLLQHPHSDLYEVAAELFNCDTTTLPMNVMTMTRESLFNLLTNIIFKKMSKNGYRFKNLNALENYVNNNLKYSLRKNKNNVLY